MHCKLRSLSEIHKINGISKQKHVLDFKLSPCSECCMLSSGQFPGVWNLYADVSEHSVCSIFIGHRNRQSVPKRWHIKFRRRGITQKKAYNICHANFRSEFAESRFAAISQIKSSIVNYSDQVLQVFNYEQHNCWLILLADLQVAKLLWQKCSHRHADSLHKINFNFVLLAWDLRSVISLSPQVCY